MVNYLIITDIVTPAGKKGLVGENAKQGLFFDNMRKRVGNTGKGKNTLKLALTPSLLFIFFIPFGSGQMIFNKSFINKIDWGYTTRWDIEQLLGKGEYLEKKITGPNQEAHPSPGLVRSNGLQYANSGITFTCADDGELVNGLEFRKSFKGLFGTVNEIEVGKTKLGDAFPSIDTFNNFTTTTASSYWSFRFNGFSFYLLKPVEDQYKEGYFNVPPFKNKLAYYKSQPISIITYDCNDYDKFMIQHTDKDDGLDYIKLIYAPKNESHLNAYSMGWPKNIPWILIPLYASTGGGKSEVIRQGYWKEYSPRHVLIYEGAYKNGKKTGKFIYYDENGKIARVEKFHTNFWN